MDDFSYTDAPGTVRKDICDAHQRTWKRLAEPGTWWTGAERIAIAAETRKASSCTLCRDRKTAISPYALKGEHDHASDLLSETAVDVIHRIVSDSKRLTKDWYEGALSKGLSDAQYVEIVGTVVSIMSIDSFCRGIGVKLHPLPKPVPGKPSYRRPPAAQQEAAWVPMIRVNSATGPESDLFDGRMTGNVMRALSLVPDEVRGLKDLSAAQYLPMNKVMSMDTGRTLDRAQMELIASRVSALNECFY